MNGSAASITTYKNEHQFTTIKRKGVGWINGKYLCSLVAVLVLLLLAGFFYVPHYSAVEVRIDQHTVKRFSSEQFCRLEGECEVVCSNNHDSSIHPGQLAAEFVSSDESGCNGNLNIESIRIFESTFPESKLGIDWLPISKPILQLTIQGCKFVTIEDGAFANLRFVDPGRLTISEFSVGTLRRNIFRGVRGMYALELRNNHYLKSIENNILEPVAATLTALQIESMNEMSEQMLKNMTSAPTQLRKVLELVIRYNTDFKNLTSGLFTSLPSLRSLILQENAINMVDAKAFEYVNKTIQKIDLQNNDIQTLPKGTLDGLNVTSNDKYRFQIFLDKNPWECNCSLEWLQTMMKENNDSFLDSPTCRTPNELENNLLVEVPLCAEATSTLPTTVEPSPTTTTEGPSTTTTTEEPPHTTTKTPDIGIITVECQDLNSTRPTNPMKTPHVTIKPTLYSAARKSRPKEKISFQKLDFEVTEVANGNVQVNIGNLTGTLLKICNENTDNYTCFSNATGLVTYDKLRRATTYTFCLLTGANQEASPYNCKALTTQPSPEKRIWLAREDRTTVLGIGIGVILLCGLISSVIVFVVVRRNPSLLRGSKRVVVVQHRSADVMVLPKNHKVPDAPISSYRSKDLQIFQTEESRLQFARSTSEVSLVTGRTSSTSYISAMEPTQEQLLQWRCDQMRARLTTLLYNKDDTSLWEETPPPLPPHPNERELDSPSSSHNQSAKTSFTSVEDYTT